MSEELKPCPFCASPLCFLSWSATGPNDKETRAEVECKTCACRITRIDSSIEGAIAAVTCAWNKRDPTPREVYKICRDHEITLRNLRYVASSGENKPLEDDSSWSAHEVQRLILSLHETIKRANEVRDEWKQKYGEAELSRSVWVESGEQRQAQIEKIQKDRDIAVASANTINEYLGVLESRIREVIKERDEACSKQRELLETFERAMLASSDNTVGAWMAEYEKAHEERDEARKQRNESRSQCIDLEKKLYASRTQPADFRGNESEQVRQARIECDEISDKLRNLQNRLWGAR